MRTTRLITLIAVLSGGFTGANTIHSTGPTPSAGAFILYNVSVPSGRETYSATDSAGRLRIRATTIFRDRGDSSALVSELITRADFSPIALRMDGQLSRSQEPLHVAIDSPRGFPIAGVYPIVGQETLLRAWLAAGRPPLMRSAPAGEDIRIELRGVDTVMHEGRAQILRRVGITGVVWGRETGWLTPDDRLAALVTFVTGNQAEALREGYEASLHQFLRSATADGMKWLAASRDAVVRTPARYALVGATVIDGTGRPPISDAVVIINNRRIEKVGTRAATPVDASIARIDLRGKTIIPGLWDMHAHFHQVEWGPVYLAAGVTTARDVGNTADVTTVMRDAISSRRGIGPQLLVAGFIDGDAPNAIGPDRAGTRAEAIALVRRYHEAGFQQIKIYARVPPALVPVITSEAHRLGMTVTGHIPAGMNLFDGVRAGMDQVNHLRFVQRAMREPTTATGRFAFAPLSPERTKLVIDELLQRGTVIDPTMVVSEMGARPASTPVVNIEPGAVYAPWSLVQNFGAGVAAADSAAARVDFEQQLEVLKRLHAAGVPIVAGTDQVVPGHSIHRELELYVRAGFTPLEAIQSASAVAAKAMGLEQDVGTISAGKRADIVILDASPLDNISNIRRINRVIAAGATYDPKRLWPLAGFAPPSTPSPSTRRMRTLRTPASP